MPCHGIGTATGHVSDQEQHVCELIAGVLDGALGPAASLLLLLVPRLPKRSGQQC